MLTAIILLAIFIGMNIIIYKRVLKNINEDAEKRANRKFLE